MLRGLPLTTRLTIFFTVLAALIVAGLDLVFMRATERHFVDLDLVALQDKQHLIEDIVQRAESAEDLRQRLNEALSHHHGLYVTMHDGGRAALYNTPGFRLPPPASAVAMPGPAANGTQPQLQHWQAEGRSYRAVSAQLRAARIAGSPLEVLIAIDTEHHDHFLAELRQTLLGYVLLAVAASGVLGWGAAHQGLAPLRAMRARAAAVSSHRFSARMPVAAVPIEMADLAAELNAMLDRLQDDYRRLAAFSSDLAHELRTPISNLLTQTQVALSTPRDASTYRNILASNAEELERMARMVADMLFLAKAERGMDLPRRESFSAALEVQALLDFYDAVAEDAGIRMAVRGDGEIDGDRLMFRRAVSNLLSNALRHGDRGSEVSVSIAAAESGRVAIAVENQGDDIAPELLPRLFDRFFRADSSRAHPAAEGAGLGLSITRAIVVAHGGDITASSCDRRIRFVMRFPGGLVTSRGDRG